MVLDLIYVCIAIIYYECLGNQRSTIFQSSHDESYLVIKFMSSLSLHEVDNAYQYIPSHIAYYISIFDIFHQPALSC